MTHNTATSWGAAAPMLQPSRSAHLPASYLTVLLPSFSLPLLVWRCKHHEALPSSWALCIATAVPPAVGPTSPYSLEPQQLEQILSTSAFRSACRLLSAYQCKPVVFTKQFLLAIGSFLLIVKLLCLHLFWGVFLLVVGALLLAVRFSRALWLAFQGCCLQLESAYEQVNGM